MLDQCRQRSFWIKFGFWFATLTAIAAGLPLVIVGDNEGDKGMWITGSVFLGICLLLLCFAIFVTCVVRVKTLKIDGHKIWIYSGLSHAALGVDDKLLEECTHPMRPVFVLQGEHEGTKVVVSSSYGRIDVKVNGVIIE